MSYPGPPGATKGVSHPSLPPRPPVVKLSGFKPAFSAAPTRSPHSAVASPTGYPAITTSYSSAPSYGVAGAPGGYGAPPSTSPYVASQIGAPTVGAGRGGYNQAGSYNYTQQVPQQAYSQQQQGAYYSGAPAATSTTSYSSMPQIRNPFPAPNTQQGSADGYDPEMAAQIAQWQSAYMPKDSSDTSGKGPGVGGRGAAGVNYSGAAGFQTATSAATEIATPPAETATASGEKHKTVYREGGGKKWTDDTLLEWDPSHLRLFVGNLAGETTDESLLKAFSRWKSVQKAKVVRDKRTTKNKGFGFVSFSDPDDFFQAAKEMNGKYIQSHPVVVHKAKTEVKPVVVKEDHHHRKGGKNWKKNKDRGPKSGSGVGGEDGVAYEPHLGATGGGITKPGQKTRGGLKLLG
ncbi:hypothetical protein B0H63DRAFT_44353 [Podospora didyma]|uniref:RRM domain-containing protein n=1 Tax=Podospora didyma TaxID=330526 RepID=A0AAE0P6Q4_9PEZI|nr:hypothetical protein B0H63DRAFT_44353 [Podospora didyma]